MKKYPNESPYDFSINSPLIVKDYDGRDIIVLLDPSGAANFGHMAILIGNNTDGWTYISKDGYVSSQWGSKSVYSVVHLSSIEEFRNSPHNFQTVENHGTGDGKGKDVGDLTFKLDKNGNKIQRYTEAAYFGTTQSDGSSADALALEAAVSEAQRDYCLVLSDCSDVVGAALRKSKDSEGTQIKSGDVAMQATDDIPRVKMTLIESQNKSDVDFDEGVKPGSTKPNAGEKTKKK